MVRGMHPGDRLARLTEREKLCLRLWLQHKSAKEIAADLRISHHAVEKRLKMARIKLGTTSSMQAARMLRDSEDYGQTVAQSADLGLPAPTSHPMINSKLIMGGMGMTIVAAAALAIATLPTAEIVAPSPTSALIREYDEQLIGVLQALIASAEIGPEGEVLLTQAVGDRRFLAPKSGYYWQISADGLTDFRSRSLWDRRLQPSGRQSPEPVHYNSDQFPNEPLRIVEQTLRLPDSDVQWRFIVARPLASPD